MMNAAAAYHDSKVLTANPAELTLMLYDGAIKFCNIAVIALEKQDFVKANLNIQKAENIITELRVTLDFNYPIAADMDKLYDFIYQHLVEANIKKDITILDEAIVLIREFRDTWKEAMKLV